MFRLFLLMSPKIQTPLSSLTIIFRLYSRHFLFKFIPLMYKINTIHGYILSILI